MITERHFTEVVYAKGNLYFFGGFDNNQDLITSVDKYSFTSKTWCQVAQMYDDRKFFRACAFMEKVFVIGGEVLMNSCLQFDTSDCSWEEVARMNEARSGAACAIFEEKIIVSGGLDYNYNDLNYVESFDVLPNIWLTWTLVEVITD